MRCPECDSADVAEIVYGLVNPDDPGLRKELDEGKVVLGGCGIFNDAPSHECNACSHSWQEPESELVKHLKEDV